MRHDPQQVLTVAAITCRQCHGSQMFEDSGRASVCHLCENGYEKVMVPAMELLMAVQVQFDDPEGLHATIVRLAEANSVRLPVLTHNSALLPNHLLPRTPRLPVVRKTAPQTFPDK